MKEDSSTVRVFLAVCPLAAGALSTEQAFFTASLAIAGFLITAFFFLLFGPMIPARHLKSAWVVWCAVWGQWFFYRTELSPLWLISVFLLAPSEIYLGQTGRWLMTRILWRGVFFWILMLYLGISREFLGHRFDLALFRHPAGSFFLLAVAAYLWQNQPQNASFRTAGKGEGG